MPKQLDPAIGKILKNYGFGADAVWDCHGTWVVYHRVLEQIAATNGVVFSMPQIIEADGGAKIAALAVEGELTGRKEWSIGEAAPGNNKNAYPWAMAEKRAKDRVILKLIGLHGLAYSEDEADDFKGSAPGSAPSAANNTSSAWKGPLKVTALKNALRALRADIDATTELDMLKGLVNDNIAIINQCKADLPIWFFGDKDKGGDIGGLEAVINAQKAKLKDT
jgi:hypothetical protein